MQQQILNRDAQHLHEYALVNLQVVQQTSRGVSISQPGCSRAAMQPWLLVTCNGMEQKACTAGQTHTC